MKSNWYKISTFVGVMDNSSIMPSFYRQEANKLLAKYYPIEIDPKMTEEEKVPYMLEWYDQIHNLIIKCQVNRGSLKEMVSASNVKLRYGHIILSLFPQPSFSLPKLCDIPKSLSYSSHSTMSYIHYITSLNFLPHSLHP